MSAAFLIDDSTLITRLRGALAFAKALAKFTTTTIDDEAVAMLSVIIENEQVQQIIEWLVNKAQSNPEATAMGLVAAIPEPMLTAANEQTAGKIGDGKLLELLVKYLPVILAMLK